MEKKTKSPMNPEKLKLYLFLFIIPVIYLLDRLTKSLVSSRLSLGDTIPAWKDVFHITLVHNSGASFGMLKGYGWFLTAVSIIIIIVLLMLYRKYTLAQSPFIAMIIGGALGNLADRFLYGYVIDFFDFRLINFPVFNIADSFVSIGAFGLIVLMLMEEYRAAKATSSV